MSMPDVLPVLPVLLRLALVVCVCCGALLISLYRYRSLSGDKTLSPNLIPSLCVDVLNAAGAQRYWPYSSAAECDETLRSL